LAINDATNAWPPVICLDSTTSATPVSVEVRSCVSITRRSPCAFAEEQYQRGLLAIRAL
jgi:hypothetical protein